MLIEGSIQITLPDNCSALRFDGERHGLSHCMKAVDFVIETPAARIFLEIKDPYQSGRSDVVRAYTEKLLRNSLDSELCYKYRDSWLYLFADGNQREPSYYFILIALDELSSDALVNRSQSLGKKIPLRGPRGDWSRPFVDQCFMFNLEGWNRNFPQLYARRVTGRTGAP